MPPEKTITSPPAATASLNTTIITITYNGSITFIPAYQTANVTMFPNITTKAPVTTVRGSAPPPPFDPNAPPEDSGKDSNKGIVWRNWVLVVMSVVIVSLVALIGVRKYRSGRAKKQELPTGDFMSVGEDDDTHSHRSPLPGGSVVSLATLGGGTGGQGTASATTASTVRERRNSVGVQPLPRAMDRKSRP